jgi:hypothetical protein
MTAGVLFSLRLFKRAEDFIADRYCIRQAFQPWRVFSEFIMSEVTMSRACRQNQIVVMDPHIHPIRVADQHELLVFINARHLSKQYGCIPLLPHNSADGRPNLTRCENRSRHLVKEWLEQVMIRTIDENDLRRRAL